MTNSSVKSRQECLAKFEDLGIEAYSEEMIPSSFAAAEYLRLEQDCVNVKKVFVIGSEGLKEEIRKNGKNLEVYGGQDAEWSSAVMKFEKDFNSMVVDETMIHAGAVVCGWDLSFNFTKLAHASLCLQKMKKPLFIATNRDAYDRLEDRDIPGNGAAVPNPNPKPNPNLTLTLTLTLILRWLPLRFLLGGKSSPQQ